MSEKIKEITVNLLQTNMIFLFYMSLLCSDTSTIVDFYLRHYQNPIQIAFEIARNTQSPVATQTATLRDS